MTSEPSEVQNIVNNTFPHIYKDGILYYDIDCGGDRKIMARMVSRSDI